MVVLITTIGLLYMLVIHGGFAIPTDATTQVLPFIYETKRMLSSGTPWWSWNSYLGDNFLASYAYYTVSNPFHLLTSLLPYKYIYIGFTFALYLKFLVCAWITDLYLRRLRFSRELCIMGSLLYTFSGWCLTNLVFYLFVEPMIALPLMLLAIKRFLHNDSHRYSGLIGATALTILLNYYFAPSNLIVSGIYFMLRLYEPDREGGHPVIREKVHTLLRAMGCVAVGVLIASPLLVPVAMQILGSPRMGHEVPTGGLLFQLDRWVSLLLPRTSQWGSGFILLESTGGSYLMNVAIFGLLPVLLNLKDRRSHWSSWFTVILLLCVIIPPLNNAFALYTNPTYSRWSYAISLSVVIGLMYYLRDRGRLPRRAIVWYSAVCITVFVALAAISVWWYRSHSDSDGLVHRIVLNGLMLTGSLAALFVMSLKSMRQQHWMRFCLWIVCGVLALNFTLTIIDNTPREGLRCQMREALRQVNSQDMSAPMTARYDYADDTVMVNLPNLHMLANRATIRSYNSVQNGHSTWQLLNMSPATNFINYEPSINRQSFDAMMSVRGIVRFNNINDTVPSGEVLDHNDSYTTYAYKYYIPMGYTYDYYAITDEVMPLYDLPERPDIPLWMLNTLVISPEDQEYVSHCLTLKPFDMTLPIDSLVQARRVYACDTIKGTTRGLRASINLDRERAVFFSVPNDPGFTAKIDGKSTKILDANLGLIAVIVPAGRHTIELDYFPPGLMAGIWLMLAGLLVTAIVYIHEIRAVHHSSIP